MAQSVLARITAILGVVVLVAGCIYEGDIGPVMRKYAVLYGVEQWRQDTGLPGDQLQGLTLPLWNQAEGQDRLQVGTVALGSTVEVMSAAPKSYQVMVAETGVVGWLEKIYVKRTYSKSNAPDPVNYPFVSSSKDTEGKQSAGTGVSSDVSQGPAVAPATGVAAGQDVKVITK